MENPPTKGIHKIDRKDKKKIQIPCGSFLVTWLTKLVSYMTNFFSYMFIINWFCKTSIIKCFCSLRNCTRRPFIMCGKWHYTWISTRHKNSSTCFFLKFFQHKCDSSVISCFLHYSKLPFVFGTAHLKGERLKSTPLILLFFNAFSLGQL